MGKPSEVADGELLDTMKWIFSEADYHYMAYWITYSGHQPYTLDSVGVSEENVARIKEKYPDLSDNYVAFLAKQMDLDQGLERMMELLRWTGKLDDVVILFFGDHIVKGLGIDAEECTMYPQMDLEFDEKYIYTDLYIYNSATEGFTYDKIGTAIDLLPTIANLWGFDYDAKTIMGRDLFDPDYSGFYFAHWGLWKGSTFYYDTINDTFSNLTDGFDETAAYEEINEYYKKQEISMKILKLDYFKEDQEKMAVNKE